MIRRDDLFGVSDLVHEMNQTKKKRKSTGESDEIEIVGVRFSGVLSVKFKNSNRWTKFNMQYKVELEKFLSTDWKKFTPTSNTV